MKKAIAIILLVLVLLGAAFVVANKLDLFSGTKATTYVYDDEEEQMEKLGKLKGKITDAVVGEAKENAELIVCEREVSVKQTWDKSWGDWGIFSKTKTMIIHGTGIYTVDLSKLSANDITVDEEKLTVTIDVPDAKLKTVDIDLPATEFEDTKNGFFRFGEIKVTAEQSTIMLSKCEDVMEVELSKDDYIDEAQKLAEQKIAELFQTVVGSVSSDYTVVIK